MELTLEASPPNKRGHLEVWECWGGEVPSGRPWSQGEEEKMYVALCIFKLEDEDSTATSSLPRGGHVCLCDFDCKGGPSRWRSTPPPV
jgi:hypothetical protein